MNQKHYIYIELTDYNGQVRFWMIDNFTKKAVPQKSFEGLAICYMYKEYAKTKLTHCNDNV